MRSVENEHRMHFTRSDAVGETRGEKGARAHPDINVEVGEIDADERLLKRDQRADLINSSQGTASGKRDPPLRRPSRLMTSSPCWTSRPTYSAAAFRPRFAPPCFRRSPSLPQPLRPVRPLRLIRARPKASWRSPSVRRRASTIDRYPCGSEHSRRAARAQRALRTPAPACCPKGDGASKADEKNNDLNGNQFHKHKSRFSDQASLHYLMPPPAAKSTAALPADLMPTATTPFPTEFKRRLELNIHHRHATAKYIPDKPIVNPVFPKPVTVRYYLETPSTSASIIRQHYRQK